MAVTCAYGIPAAPPRKGRTPPAHADPEPTHAPGRSAPSLVPPGRASPAKRPPTAAHHVEVGHDTAPSWVDCRPGATGARATTECRAGAGADPTAAGAAATSPPTNMAPTAATTRSLIFSCPLPISAPPPSVPVHPSRTYRPGRRGTARGRGPWPHWVATVPILAVMAPTWVGMAPTL